MARPCGCSGECGCTYVGVDGIRVVGTGTTRDPGKIGLTNPLIGSGCDAIMSCVSTKLGSGLKWDAVTGRLLVALSGDGGNTLAFGSDGGLFTAGGGTGGDSGFATVESLKNRAEKVIGGSYGAGLAMWPEGPLENYKAAMNMRLPIIHVPVRKSAEFFLWAVAKRAMGSYHFRYGGNVPDSMDLVMGERMWFTPGGDPLPPTVNWPAPFYEYANKAGYFGYSSPVRQGMARLSDVFETTQRRSVLYLEVKDLGQSNLDSPVPLLTFNLLALQIAQFGLQKSAIVGVNIPTSTNTADRTSITDGLTLIKNAGIETAVHFNTEAEMNATPPATLTTLGVTWAFVAYTLIDVNGSPTVAAKVKAYKDAGINVMVHSAHRQWHFQYLSHAFFGAGGLKGAICFDPTYCGGALTNFGYRELAATWSWGTPNYGVFSSWATEEGMRDLYRGYTIPGAGVQLVLDGNVRGPLDPSPGPGNPDPLRETGYHILMGEQCPMSESSYDIEVGFILDSRTSDSSRWMSVTFCVPEDRPFYDWVKTDQFTKGYQLQLTQAGQFRLLRYDGIPFPGGDPNVNIPYQYGFSWNSPWTNGGNGVDPVSEARIKIRVRPDRLIIGPSFQAEGGANTRTFSATVNPLSEATKWRGHYFYLGRHFWTDADSTRVRFQQLTVTLNP